MTGVPFLAGRPPRCPHLPEVTTVEDLMPYIREVAGRPYSQGLHAAWDLKPGERVLLRVDNWYDPMCVEAAVRVIEEHGCTATVESTDRGPKRRWEGHDEVELFVDVTRWAREDMIAWRKIEAEGRFDKLLWGFGGPVLSDSAVKVQRMPFITPEMTASRAHTLPYEVLDALDQWTWRRIANARRVRITDPEGTDIAYTNHDAYYDSRRLLFAEDAIRRWYPENVSFQRGPLPGHIWGKPSFFIDEEDGAGVVAGTMNHIGTYPHVAITVEGSKVVRIEGGGQYGDKLRELQARTEDLVYPGMPGPGLLHWWEASIGTNPKIHRPRTGFGLGWVCPLFERMRSGIVHMGFGTVISSQPELEAVDQGLPAGHWHVHLNFATVTVFDDAGQEDRIIEEGHLLGLDDPELRAVAGRFGDPDALLIEDWVPAIPGINLEGDYWNDYAHDPEDWTQTELHICQRWHPLFMKMVAPPTSR